MARTLPLTRHREALQLSGQEMGRQKALSRSIDPRIALSFRGHGSINYRDHAHLGTTMAQNTPPPQGLISPPRLQRLPFGRHRAAVFGACEALDVVDVPQGAAPWPPPGVRPAGGSRPKPVSPKRLIDKCHHIVDVKKCQEIVDKSIALALD